MARTVRDTNLETRTARLRLAARAKPYWRVIDTGLHLGYRRAVRGSGSWVARRFIAADADSKGRYGEARVGTADDLGDADGVTVRSFRQAQLAAREWLERELRPAAAKVPAGPYTVAMALDAYFAERESDGSKGLKHDRSAARVRKLVFVGNAKVAIPDTGGAMSRRFIFLTFDATIPKAERDTGLKDKLEREGAGILNWMLAGLRDYLAGGGLRVPAAMRDAAHDYLAAEDTFGTFLADTFEAGPSFTVAKVVLRACYEEWCKENGHQPLGQTALTRKLNERSHSLDRNTRTFSGIRRPPLVLPAGRA